MISTYMSTNVLQCSDTPETAFVNGFNSALQKLGNPWMSPEQNEQGE